MLRQIGRVFTQPPEKADIAPRASSAKARPYFRTQNTLDGPKKIKPASSSCWSSERACQATSLDQHFASVRP